MNDDVRPFFSSTFCHKVTLIEFIPFFFWTKSSQQIVRNHVPNLWIPIPFYTSKEMSSVSSFKKVLRSRLISSYQWFIYFVFPSVVRLCVRVFMFKYIFVLILFLSDIFVNSLQASPSLLQNTHHAASFQIFRFCTVYAYVFSISIFPL